MSRISLIAAMDRNRLIGRGNALPWHLPADLARFKRLTWGKPIVMGRRTYESIGRPLPGRRNLVVSRKGVAAPGCEVVDSLEAALARAAPAEEIMVIGGAQLYAAALDRATRIYLTLIDAVFEGDAHFPAFDAAAWREIERTPGGTDPVPFTFIVLERGR